MRFQIRDADNGLAVYYRESAREALYAFLADRVKGEVRGEIEEADDGSRAEVVYRGERLSAVRATEKED